MNQKIKQTLSVVFPGYIKKMYFKDLERARSSNSIETNHAETELLFIDELIPQDAIIIDIGANRGDYVFVLEKSNKCKEIYAVEPIPELNKQLKNLFPNHHICSEAISNRNGKQQFNIPFIQSRYFDTRGTLENFSENNQNATRTIDVETITLDDFVKKYSISSVDLIKMDIEGHEYAALQGAKIIMHKLRPLMMVEIEQRHHADVGIEEIFSFIQTFGYSGYFFDDKNKSFNTINTFDVSQHQQTDRIHVKKEYLNNFIFIPDERQAHYLGIFSDIVKRLS